MVIVCFGGVDVDVRSGLDIPISILAGVEDISLDVTDGCRGV